MRCEDCHSRSCLDNGICDQSHYTGLIKDCLGTYESRPPTDKQVSLVQSYLRYNRFVRHPDYNKQSYYEFIRDVVIKDDGFRYNPTRVPYVPDEDRIMEFCQNDVWCEEY